MTSPGISFVVPGPPVGKARPNFFRRGGKVGTYTPQKTTSYENLVKLVAREAMQTAGAKLFHEPLTATIIATQTPPESWSKKKRAAALSGEIMPTSKPDADNIAKAVLDACNGIVFLDDKQVCSLFIKKNYGEEPGTFVSIGPCVPSTEEAFLAHSAPHKRTVS